MRYVYDQIMTMDVAASAAQKSHVSPRAKAGAAAPLLDLLELGAEVLTPVEKAQIRFVRRTFSSQRADVAVRFLQRTFGAFWIERCVKNLRHVHGFEQLGTLDPAKSYLCVSNHRSFFDMYVITSFLVAQAKLPHRLLFPVRSKFFYDQPAGLLVNGAMSFFAMYPPVFRERSRMFLNRAMMDETSRLLRQGGFFVGLHPEGQRSTGSDPYQLLPARFGVGKIILDSNVTVIPAFINGLGNDIKRQIVSNFDGTGEKIHLVFGAPMAPSEFSDCRNDTQGQIKAAQRCLDRIAELGAQERALRARS